ncbi:MAG TPA: glycosyltransferase [Candidatus Koribacter sp.]|jgi:4-amino-4-deoxy-L-arabinose transferase-like glycosyltransferase
MAVRTASADDHPRNLGPMDQPLNSVPSLREHLSAFSLIFTALFLTHAALLRLPYFWDEAGYYIPAARDVLLTGDLIPHTTLSNAHPPLLMLYLAGWWKFSGYTPAVTRIAMLLVACFALLGIWRLAAVVSNRTIAALAVLCTAIYPVFFAQSTLAHLDMLAGVFTLWGLAYYIENKPGRSIVLLALASLAKETAVLAPVVLCGWEIIQPARFRLRERNLGRALLYLLCGLPLALWFVYHHHRTGYFLGNPDYLRYNLGATLTPLRIVLALGLRLWHTLGYMNLFVLTLLTAAAMLEPAQDSRKRIALPVQMTFYVLIAAYVLALAVLGGAVLARYLLPVYPLIVLVCVSTLHRRLRWWPAAISVVVASFIAGLLFNPPYRFAPEDNLTYRDYVLLHKEAANYLALHAHGARVLTAWPASDEISRPFLGYVKEPVPVVRIENFSPAQMQLASAGQEQYDWAYVFSTKYEPPHLLIHSAVWERMQRRFFDYHTDLPPEIAAQMIGGRIVYRAQRRGEWVALIQIERPENARLEPPTP